MNLKYLSEIFPESTIKYNEAMANYSYTKTGGPADALIFPESAEEIMAIIRYANREHIPVMALGNASNLIIQDQGIAGIVIMLTAMTAMSVSDQELTAQSGARIIDVSRLAADAGLTGLEFACGIPGSVGGAIYMNAGAYGGEISTVVKEVHVVTLAGRKAVYTPEELDFAYRHSEIQASGDIIVSVVFSLENGDQEAIRQKMAELTYLRESKQPLDLPSCGSVFKRPEGHFTGKLIQEAGLQGYTVGGAQVSTKHAGFIVNIGQATASDYLAVIHHVQEVIWHKNGVQLEREVRIIGRDDTSSV
ncbi:UDP-N-acetylmuramate dehydrogenase [Aerococcus kribbianus]|uniref:UDP-N-acetylenolpyruvoylglucosamine reductase n=1 Tax=Aerococcus kribbianus TaxID=2999064 RepID=A0A9X3FM84_9LACT|nr:MULTISPECIES: UDP-N-acetylmuramate dehydrogenase [unclassified Aerococcus]MCZ0717075.1 UDP-N-acetylmuramate dehydrogenase [Aerococcus sp. YH-aer221]MCZ0725363.1 UDP-N-acetylmuramate dehydrogenase [Aerococcus sp. YH-aer222]